MLRKPFISFIEILPHTVASTVLLVYDWMLMFPAELEVVWSAKLRPLNVIYIIQRYLPFVDTIGVLYVVVFAKPIDPDTCRTLYDMSGWMYIIGIALTEVILTMRTWALWGQNIKLTIGLPIFFLCCWVPNFYIMQRFLDTQTYMASPFPNQVGCVILGGQPVLFLCWIILMIYEAGITYYIYLFVLSIVNVVVILSLSHDLENLFSPPQRVIQTLLTSRAILHMRSQSRKQSQLSSTAIASRSLEIHVTQEQLISGMQDEELEELELLPLRGQTKYNTSEYDCISNSPKGESDDEKIESRTTRQIVQTIEERL
ncbi:hypothetical protein BT96DRAFT_979524 [Gymnopus androsaceus JB14]|uniref:DUF6533 domain-containing protein n=1 Tax=Gymnopus androsaceus JB14 TaxID=1447944 RepID=A0A6A4H3G4_9AGAR|nr:hypothetical protein BT96DRAFT_979524 [Gymnopus androsaceus JB14]